ncbi:Rieske 2Fe-2S domain-containing protein [Pendulispora rubella]|uniref:Rieske 2Fe-2S domain-containing protein n=1 Tax=Pendulispora rubella TaxID=2741070 RepID=A0ABZ2KVL2_9BACT
MNHAASWYALARSSDIGTKPTRLLRFGERWVAWRDREGKAAVMGESCPHFGASLAGGHVDREGCLVCPFHRWRFDASGACVGIPGSDVIPATARRRPLVTVERYGILWGWWGSGEPQFSLPNVPEYDEPRGRSVLDFSINTTLPLVLANSYDARHLVETHRSAAVPRSRTHAEAEFTPEGIAPEAWCAAELELELSRQTLREAVALISAERSWYGFTTTLSGFLGTWVMTRFAGMRSIRARVNGWPTGHHVRGYVDGKPQYSLLTSGCPIDETRCLVLSVTLLTKRSGPVRDFMGTLFSNMQLRQAAATDAVIFDTLDLRARGVHVREDRPILEYLKLHERYVGRVDPAWLGERAPRRRSSHEGRRVHLVSSGEGA